MQLDPTAMAGQDTHMRVLESLAGLSGSIADVGTGQGALAVELARLGFDVYACDADVNAFRAGGVERIGFAAADLNGRFPYPDERFDVVCAVEIIEHLENPRHFLRECQRTLKRGGLMVVTTPNILNVASLLTLAF